jgi:tRNA A-37 threonylcarbamoyl transferase component Bud32
MAATHTIPTGTPLGPYIIGGILGQGASATVYRAQDSQGRPFAVKVRRAGDTYQDRRFLREFESMRLLRIDGVVPVHRAGIEGSWLWFSMELVHGRGFLAALHEEDYLIDRVSQTLDRSIQLLDTLAELHRDGFVHRDIKPSNVLVDRAGRVHVLDFGIGRYFDDTSTLSESGEVIGTVPYMAPEQLASLPLNGRVDLFATGLMIHEAIAGKRERPFTTVGWIPKICMERLPALASLFPEVPLGFSHIVERLLAVDPRARPTAGEAAAHLRALKAGRKSCEWPEAVYVDPGPWTQKVDQCIDSAGPPIVILDGPAGSGRRRAAEQVHRSALLQGRWTLHLHCRPEIVGGPLVELLEVLIASLDDKDLSRVIGPDADAIRQLWPHLLIPVSTPDPTRNEERSIQQALADIISRLPQIRTVLLIFHDTERIDSFSAGALSAIADHASPDLSLLLIHERRWKTARSSALIHAMRSTGKTHRITVPPMSATASARLIEHLCPDASAIIQKDMRPIQVMEVAWRTLSRRRADVYPDVPDSLWPLAISDQPLPAPVYRSLTSSDAEFGPWVERNSGGMTLRGQTVRNVALSQMASLARCSNRIAKTWSKTLADLADQGELAWYWLLSNSPRLAWQPAAKAAVESARRGLYADARKWMLLLDEMAPPSSDHADLVFQLACVRARVALRTAAISSRKEVLENAESLARTPGQQQQIATLHAEFDLRDGVVKPALVHALHIGSHQDGRTAIRARFIAIHCRLTLYQLADAQRELQRARAILALHRFPILEAQAENWAAEIAYRGHDLASCREHCQRAIQISDENAYIRGRAFATARLGRLLRQLGNRREAERQMITARDAFARTGDVYLDADTGLALATLQAERGEILGARHLLDQSIRRIRSLHLDDFLPTAMRLTLQLATMRLDPSEATLALNALAKFAKTDSETPSVLTRWWRIRGDFARAMDVEGPSEKAFGYAAWRAERARAALASGARDMARDEARRSLKIARDANLAEVETYAGLVLGLLEEVDDRAWNDLIRRANSSVWTEVYLAALELDARRHSESDDPEGAKRKWHTCRARAVELGYQPAVEEANGWLD